jgi:phenylalanyl-tRNA synthetase beta chain
VLLARVGVQTESPTDAPGDLVVTVADGARPLRSPADDADAVVAIVPTWRRDIAIEADVAEEIARVAGYETIPNVLPHTPMPAFRPAPLAIRDRVRETLAGAGLTETVSHALVSPRHAERFAWTAEVAPVRGGAPAVGRPIHVTNPLSADHSVLRPALVGSLVEIAAMNVRRGRDDVAIFEIGKGYGRDGETTREWWRLGLALSGALEEPSWNRPRRLADLDDAKGIVELVCGRLGFTAPTYRSLADEPLLHPGRAIRVTAHRNGATALAGVIGELHPDIADELDLRGARLVVAELDLAGLSGGHVTDRAVRAPSRQPAAERDLAVVVDEAVPAATLAATIRSAAGPELADLRLFDIYRGVPLAASEKSVAWRLVFQAAERTLTDHEIDAAVAAVSAALIEIGGRIRT